jgi:hypothetical protein
MTRGSQEPNAILFLRSIGSVYPKSLAWWLYGTQLLWIRRLNCKEIESIIKNLPTKKNVGPDDFTGEFFTAFKGEFTPSFLKLSKNRRGGNISKHILGSTFTPYQKVKHKAGCGG